MTGPSAREPQPGEPEHRERWGSAGAVGEVYHAAWVRVHEVLDDYRVRLLAANEENRALRDAGNALADVVDRWFSNEPVEPTELSDALGSWRGVAGP